MLALIILILVPYVNPARILVFFPTGSLSHSLAVRPFVYEIARRGHQVTFITADPLLKDDAPKNLKEISVHYEAYESFRQEFLNKMSGDDETKINELETVKHHFAVLMDTLLGNEDIKNLIRNKTNQFDLLILETCVRPALVFSYVFKSPVIQLSTFSALYEVQENLGGILSPVLYPSIVRSKFYNRTFWEMAEDVYLDTYVRFHFKYAKEYENVVLKKHFKQSPTINELERNINLLFLKVHPIWENNRAVPVNVVYIGGVSHNSRKELPQVFDLKAYLDSAKNGFIYMSFGTNVNPTHFSAEKMNVFINVFSKLPYNVLLRWNHNISTNLPENVKISKWLPQVDVLSHKNIKLIITHGGIHSIEEAIGATVPVLVMPMFGDQGCNAEMVRKLKIGTHFDLGTLSEHSLKQSIETVINESSFREALSQVKSIIMDQPQSPLERAVWWTEYVLRHGGAKHLRSPAANMSWSEYLELELIITTLVVTTIMLFFIFYVVYLAFISISRRS